MMKRLIDRLKAEPILSRAGMAAVLNVLVLSGVLDTPGAEAIDSAAGAVKAAVLALVNVYALLSARGKVTPDADLVDYAEARREAGLPVRTS